MTARTGKVRPFEPPPAARESLQGHYAGFASRFAAFVLDLVVLTGIFILVLAAINFTASVLTGESIHFNHDNTWVVVAYAVWAFIYFAHFWGLNGKTAGGALFGVQVVTNDGGDVSGRRAIWPHAGVPAEFPDPLPGLPGHIPRRPAPRPARPHRRDGRDLLLGRAGGAAAVAVPAPVLSSAPSARIGQPARIAGPGRPALLTRTRRFVWLRPDAVVVVILRRDCPRDRHRRRQPFSHTRTAG